MTVELIGAQKAQRDLAGVAHRLEDTSEVMRRETKVVETAEAGVFAGLAGRYVRTGAVMRSLTLPTAPGAIRRVTRGSLEFGTSIRYARYLTEHIGPPTEAGGMKRPKPVAVLKLTEATRRQVARDVMDHVTGQQEATAGLGATFLGGMI